MAPKRKRRKVNGKFVSVNEEPPSKEGAGAVDKGKTKVRLIYFAPSL
jgi:hypothetical protein